MARLLKADDKIIDKLKESIKKGLSGFDVTTNKIEYTLPKVNKKCTVFIPNTIQRKINALVDTCQKEIAWHVTVQRAQEDLFEVTDIIMFPQTVTGATVTSDDADYTEWIMSLDDDIFDRLKGHMHSHVNMGVRPSGVDTTYQNQVAQNEEDFYLFAIWNKKGDNWFRIVDIKNNILYEDEDITIDTDITSEDEWARAMIDRYVSEYKPTNKPNTNYEMWKGIINDNDTSDWAKFVQEELSQDF